MLLLLYICCLFVGVSPSGKAPGFGPGIPRFESLHPSHFSFISDFISVFWRGVEQSGSSLGS